MADKILIEIFKEKKADDFTAALSSPDKTGPVPVTA